MRLLLDEILGPNVARELRARGFDVTAVVERTDLRAQPDDVVLEQARDEERVVVTRNVADFARLHQQWSADGREHAGIVMVTNSAFPEGRAFVGALVAALELAARTATLPQRSVVVFLRSAVQG